MVRLSLFRERRICRVPMCGRVVIIVYSDVFMYTLPDSDCVSVAGQQFLQVETSRDLLQYQSSVTAQIVRTLTKTVENRDRN